MILTETQAKLFYDLWIPLLDFVNRKHKLCKNFYGMDSPKGLPLDVVRIISGKLWEDTSVIDEYLSKSAQDMSEERMSIIRGWKKVIHGKFVVERHLKNGSILVSCDEDGSVYRVCLGRNMADQARQMYLNAKERKKIIEFISVD